MFDYELTSGAAMESDTQRIALGLRQRDLIVLEALVEQYQYRLVRYLIYLLGGRGGVDDLVQEIWLRVLERGSSYDGAACFPYCSLAVCLTAVSANALVVESALSPQRRDSMMLRRSFSIVPKQVQLWASVVVGCALLIGLVGGYGAADQGAVLRTMSAFGSAALVLGILIGIWLLCLGFVFADARRRAMRPVPWVLVAALFPSPVGIPSLLCFAPANRFDLRSLRKHRSALSAILLMVRCRASRTELDERTTHRKLVARSKPMKPVSPAKAYGGVTLHQAAFVAAETQHDVDPRTSALSPLADTSHYGRHRSRNIEGRELKHCAGGGPSSPGQPTVAILSHWASAIGNLVSSILFFQDSA